ncbi:Protein of unknown function [Pyronema omphalodes CBS 100304]|uniref:Uncharacterized protein n=1 Tax=Pyronema omphalodes (strain CBS 100304) TaxID=1076935 RepID=U4KTT1_PYROM|nr:Protein of unknown function [Pyronema omphalodes CBS 100304]
MQGKSFTHRELWNRIVGDLALSSLGRGCFWDRSVNSASRFRAAKFKATGRMHLGTNSADCSLIVGSSSKTVTKHPDSQETTKGKQDKSSTSAYRTDVIFTRAYPGSASSAIVAFLYS